MQDLTVEIRIPASIVQYGFEQDDLQRRVIEWLVISLFTDEQISSGKAAQLLGISRIEFLALLRKRGVAYIDYSAEELADELAAVEALAVNADS